jgi:hypothetical protein
MSERTAMVVVFVVIFLTCLFLKAGIIGSFFLALVGAIVVFSCYEHSYCFRGLAKLFKRRAS